MMMMTISKTIREFAAKAKLISENEAEWFAIDTEGTVYAYKEKPVIKSEACTVWDISDLKHSCWLIGNTDAPDNFKDELYEISQILEFAKNMANSPKDTANSPDLKPSNSTELKQLAELAAERGFAWIAQDKSRAWYGYKNEPEFREILQEWRSRGGNNWAALNLPDNTDYSKQIFNVKTILENE